MSSKMSEAIKQWAEQNETDCGGYVGIYGIPYTALKILEQRIADVLSNNCPEGGCHSSVFDEE